MVKLGTFSRSKFYLKKCSCWLWQINRWWLFWILWIFGQHFLVVFVDDSADLTRVLTDYLVQFILVDSLQVFDRASFLKLCIVCSVMLSVCKCILLFGKVFCFIGHIRTVVIQSSLFYIILFHQSVCAHCEQPTFVTISIPLTGTDCCFVFVFAFQ